MDEERGIGEQNGNGIISEENEDCWAAFYLSSRSRNRAPPSTTTTTTSARVSVRHRRPISAHLVLVVHLRIGHSAIPIAMGKVFWLGGNYSGRSQHYCLFLFRSGRRKISHDLIFIVTWGVIYKQCYLVFIIYLSFAGKAGNICRWRLFYICYFKDLGIRSHKLKCKTIMQIILFKI